MRRVGARRLAGTMLKFALAWYDLRTDNAAAGAPAQGAVNTFGAPTGKLNVPLSVSASS